jgi:pimeloyl-ACP methyl ester carboxylesterase
LVNIEVSFLKITISNTLTRQAIDMKAHLEEKLDIHYEIFGSGPETLLFVHGLGTTGKSWHRLIPTLSPYFQCITLDLPGYGHSTKSNFPFSISFFAKKIAAFLDHLNLHQVIIVGHSMGGQVALEVALHYPDKAKGMVLFAPAGFETFTKAGRDLILQWYTPELLKDLTPAQVRRNFEANFYTAPPEMEEMIKERLAMMKTPEYDHFCMMIPQCVKGMLEEPVFEYLENIKIPVLVYFGKNDKLIPSPLLRREVDTASIAEKGTEKLSSGRLILLENCGHFIPMECPEKVADSCQQFLKEITD